MAKSPQGCHNLSQTLCEKHTVIEANPVMSHSDFFFLWNYVSFSLKTTSRHLNIFLMKLQIVAIIILLFVTMFTVALHASPTCLSPCRIGWQLKPRRDTRCPCMCCLERWTPVSIHIHVSVSWASFSVRLTCASLYVFTRSNSGRVPCSEWCQPGPCSLPATGNRHVLSLYSYIH